MNAQIILLADGKEIPLGPMEFANPPAVGRNIFVGRVPEQVLVERVDLEAEVVYVKRPK